MGKLSNVIHVHRVCYAIAACDQKSRRNKDIATEMNRKNVVFVQYNFIPVLKSLKRLDLTSQYLNNIFKFFQPTFH